jgi:hypothetical protein
VRLRGVPGALLRFLFQSTSEKVLANALGLFVLTALGLVALGFAVAYEALRRFLLPLFPAFVGLVLGACAPHVVYLPSPAPVAAPCRCSPPVLKASPFEGEEYPPRLPGVLEDAERAAEGAVSR